MKALRRMSGALRQGPLALLPVAFLWAPVLVGLETLGRRFTSDMADAAALLFVSGLVCLNVAWLSGEALKQSCSQLWGRLVMKRLGSWRLQFGVDLRGTPPIPRALPPVIVRTLLLLALAVALLIAEHEHFPAQAREVLVSVSYSLYLLLLAATWGALVVAAFLLLSVTHLLVHDQFVTSCNHQGRRSPRNEVIVHGVLLAGLALACLTLPPWLAMLLLAIMALLSLTLVSLPANPDVALLWRPRQSHGAPLRMHLRSFLLSELLFYFLVTAVLVLISRGDRLLSDPAPGPMQITPVLGTVFSWSAVIGLCAVGVRTLRSTLMRRSSNPSRATRPVVFVHGASARRVRLAVRNVLRGHCWRPRFTPHRPSPCDVQVKLVSQRAARSAFDLNVSWPLEVTMQDLEDPDILHRCKRRRETQCRRLLVRGLKKLFKGAARRDWQKGDGFWVGPHLWFVSGLTRDKDEERPDFEKDTLIEAVIGPPFHRLFAQPVRHHLFTVLKALMVDLIFVEDGVTFRRFRRVLDNLFELYDISGSSQRAEERHFRGLPGISVHLHDFDMENPYRSETYPEPDYEDIGRARILHVFVDRGGEKESMPVPVDADALPALV